MTTSGIEVYNSTAIIGGQNAPQHSGNLISGGLIGISALESYIEVDNNTIEGSIVGVGMNVPVDNSRITQNLVMCNSLGNIGQGILGWMANNILIENNVVTGNRTDLSIVCRDCESSHISNNAVDVASSSHGIVVSGGMSNHVTHNDIQNRPTNAIGIYGSTLDTIADNDIEANYVGLYVGRNLSTDLEITCNRFCSGFTDINIGSLIGEQRHHENQFRENGSVAKINEDFQIPSQLLDDLRFIYEHEDTTTTHCSVMRLLPDDNQNDIFRPGPGSSTQNCVEGSGPNFTGSPEEVLCEELMREGFDVQGWYSRLRQVLGSYFATHGPGWLPDCVKDCYPTELIEYEHELRTAMTGQSTANNVESESLRAVANRQYIAMQAASSVPTIGVEPCPTEVEEVALHTSTYTKLVKQLGTDEGLSNQDMAELRSVAILCIHEYGEAVTWARGLLELNGIYDYEKQDCTGAIQERATTQSVVEQMLLFPNPADDKLTIGLSTAAVGQIEIVDLTGKVIYSVRTNLEAQVELSTASFENGMYLVRYRADEKSTYQTQKLVIQHKN